MTTSPPADRPHRRYDPLRDSWVLVSPGRSARPWRGQLEPSPEPSSAAPAHDPTCQLCPGNVRASGIRNPPYDGTFVFDNDFPALRQSGSGEEAPAEAGHTLFRVEPVDGIARVMCFSPRHDASLGSLALDARRAVVDTWADQTRELGATHRWVQVFENRGEAMGASNPHPHGQIWASTSLPVEAEREDRTQRAHLDRTGRVLLDEVRSAELGGPRVVAEVGSWLALVPFWATWPFETLVIGPVGAARLDELDAAARDDLARLLGDLLTGCDALFRRPLPYSMGWHQAPHASPDPGAAAPAGAGIPARHWRLHAHVYPPLLRADARKFMVGYELLAEPQRDLSPEEAAARLRSAVESASS